MDLISIIEEATGKRAEKNFMPMQAGDVYATYADTDDLARDIDFKPSTSLKDGVSRFVDWYKGYHG